MIKQMQRRDCIDERLLESFRNARSQGGFLNTLSLLEFPESLHLFHG